MFLICIGRLTVTTRPVCGSHGTGCYTNRLADGLANYAFSLPLDFYLFEARPDVVTSIAFGDVNGYVRPRNVCVLGSFRGFGYVRQLLEVTLG